MKTCSSVLFALALVFSLIAGCTPSTPTPLPIPPTPSLSPIPPTATVNPALLPVRGLYVQFERRGWHSEYWSGEVINSLNMVDSQVGHTIGEEVAIQLDQMKQMGVNTIAFELRSSTSDFSGPFTPPTCNIPPFLGLHYPQPTLLEKANLADFFDLLESKGMKVYLRLVNTHMEEQPPTNNELWLGTILKAIKDHPALDLVSFEGNSFMIDSDGDGVNDNCGIPAEPPLWEGPGSIPAKYVEWAIDYAHSLGLPYRQLSAEAIVGDYLTMSQAPNQFMTDGHFWNPIVVLKGIFDNLSIPDNERTYAISFYEHRKCVPDRGIPCVDEDPHQWAIETAEDIFNTIGRGNGARVVAVEMGLLNPVESSWTTEMALESLVWVMKTYGIDGGCFWRWAAFDDAEQLDSTLAEPVKQRGVEFNYNPVKDVLQALYTTGQVANPAFAPGTPTVK